MSMAIDFDAIRRDYPLETVVAKVVQLRRSGANKVACCPFHADKTPSLVLYKDHTYHCFGCGAHGDVLDFVAGTQRTSISGAIRYLTGGNAPVLDEIDQQRRAQEMRQREAAQAKHAQDAVQGARSRWQRALPVDGTENGYLMRKNVAPYGCRREGENLLVPIFDEQGLIASVQSIPPEAGGKKLFHAGAPVKGGTFTIGDAKDGPVIIAEGFATGATVQMATGHLVVIGFSKGALKRTAELAAKRYPGRAIVIAADANGIDEAQAASDAVGGRVALPDLLGADGTDFNDQAAHYGLDDVAACFIVKSDSPAGESPLPLVWAKDVVPVLGGNWIVKRVIPADGFVSVIGEPGCGKSFFVLDLSCHIAAGLEWCGRKVKQGLVIYLAAEGQRGQMNRVEAWKREHGVEDMPFALIPVAINLRDEKADVPKLIQTIEVAIAASGLPLSMLVIDTLNRSFGGGDENGEDMGQYVVNADKVRAHFKCTTAHVHHIPKSGDLTERGHGSLRGAIDTSLGIQNDPETGRRTLICLKQKDGEDGWKMGFTLKSVVLGQDEDGEDVTTCVTQPDQPSEATTAKGKGPNLSATQRLAYNELLATIEAAGVAVPRDIPDDQLNRMRVGKVAARAVWRERWMAIQGAEMSTDSASATFRRAVTDLINKGLVGAWNDHVWATHK